MSYHLLLIVTRPLQRRVAVIRARIISPPNEPSDRPSDITHVVSIKLRHGLCSSVCSTSKRLRSGLPREYFLLMCVSNNDDRTNRPSPCCNFAPRFMSKQQIRRLSFLIFLSLNYTLGFQIRGSTIWASA